MDKFGVVREGLTPPESPPEGQKKAALEKPPQLEEHVTRRVADVVIEAKQGSEKKP